MGFVREEFVSVLSEIFRPSFVLSLLFLATGDDRVGVFILKLHPVRGRKLRAFPLGNKLGVKISCGDWYRLNDATLKSDISFWDCTRSAKVWSAMRQMFVADQGLRPLIAVGQKLPSYRVVQPCADIRVMVQYHAA
ncbi:hypothetical protein TNCV_2993291 [Trichonephila clavipes]|nr:hypothetical protein TNCV_2993291 [Trichonephila clavipes]